jgi:hypothetical protein
MKEAHVGSIGDGRGWKSLRATSVFSHVVHAILEKALGGTVRSICVGTIDYHYYVLCIMHNCRT